MESQTALLIAPARVVDGSCAADAVALVVHDKDVMQRCAAPPDVLLCWWFPCSSTRFGLLCRRPPALCWPLCRTRWVRVNKRTAAGACTAPTPCNAADLPALMRIAQGPHEQTMQRALNEATWLLEEYGTRASPS
jgi:hypothetical protein